MITRKHVVSNVLSILLSERECCVLRKTEFLDQSTIDDDIDLLVNQRALRKISTYLKAAGFKKSIDSKLTNTYLYGSLPHVHFKNISLDLHFDCVTSICVQSLYAEAHAGYNLIHWLPLDQAIQFAARNEIRSIEHNGLIIPCLSYNVEFVHILSHVIFDKKGAISDYYQSRLNFLIEVIDRTKTTQLLTTVFFNFSNRLYELVYNQSYSTIYSDFLKFEDY